MGESKATMSRATAIQLVGPLSWSWSNKELVKGLKLLGIEADIAPEGAIAQTNKKGKFPSGGH